MMEAVAFVQNGNSLRQAARLYNVPVEKVVAGGKHDGGRSLRPKWQFAASGSQAI